MKLMKTQDAVGQVLCHDITQIIKGVTKDAVFRKGHVITEEDIPVLLSVGKDNVYIWLLGVTSNPYFYMLFFYFFIFHSLTSSLCIKPMLIFVRLLQN